MKLSKFEPYPTGFGRYRASYSHNILQDTFYMKGATGRTVKEFDCRAIFDGNETEIARAVKHSENNPKIRFNLTAFNSMIDDCEAFKLQRGYPKQPFSYAERNFPLAFT